MCKRLAFVRSVYSLARRAGAQACRQLACGRCQDGVEHARDVYTRRQEGVSIWVVQSSDIAASDPS